MKFLKKLFSKTVVVAILFILQLVFLAIVLQYFNKYFFAVQVASLVLGCIGLLTLINKKESPEFKLPWIILFLMMPIFAYITYAMFAQAKMPKTHLKKITSISEEIKPFTKLPKGYEDLDDGFSSYLGLENYLQKTSYTYGHVGSDAVYFSSGEDFYKDLLCELETAKEFIFMEYFIIGYGKMWDGIYDVLKRKVSEGVEVRIIYDDIGSTGYVTHRFAKELSKQGIKCLKFNPFHPILSGIHNNRDHRKITVIDGRIAYTGGINIDDDYINVTRRLGYWKDTAIKIKGSAVQNLTGMFLLTFDMATKTVSDYEKYFSNSYELINTDGYVHPFGDGPKPFYKEQVGENTFIHLINVAKEYIYISSPYLIIDHNISTALKNSAMRGVDVRIITPKIPDKKIIFSMTRSNYKHLTEAGVKIYEYTPGFIHAKGIVSDDKVAFVGTINLDYRSFVHHYECGAILYNLPCVKDIKTDFDNTIMESELITEENFKQGFFSRLISSVLNIFSPML